MFLIQIDLDVLIEVLLTKVLNAFFYAFLARVNKMLDLFDDLVDLPIAREEDIFSISEHEKQFGGMLVIMGDFEVLKEEVEGSMDKISCKKMAVLEIRDEFDQETIPMRVYVERIHAEVDYVDDVLLVLVVACLFLLLVVLEDDGIGLLEGIIIVKQGFHQLIDTELSNECEFLEFASGEESVLESSQIAQDNLDKKRDDATVLQGN